MARMVINNIAVCSTKDAGKMLGVTHGRIRQLIDEKKLKAFELNERALAVTLDSIEEYKKAYRKPGPKPAHAR
jgi:hypothetical protein